MKINAILNKVTALILRLWHYDPWREYVDAGVIDLSGQGRNKYGK